MDGAAGDAAVFGKDQRAAIERGHAELRVGGAQRFEDGAIARLAERGKLQADGADVQADVNAHFCLSFSVTRKAGYIQVIQV